MIDFPGLLDTLVRRRWIIIATFFLFVALAIAGLMVIKPRYTATARIFIDPRQQRVLQNEVVQQGVGEDMALVDSQIEVIKSESVLAPVVKKEKLASDPEFVPADLKKGDPAEIALAGLSKATEVTRPDNTYVLQISVTTKQAVKSARLANAITAAYIADQASAATGVTRDISSAIHDRLSSLQKQLQASEEKVAAFKRTHDISQPGGQLLGDRRLTELAARQAEAESQANTAKTRLQVMKDSLRKRGYVDPAATGSDSVMGALLVRLTEARRHLAELQTSFGPRYPSVSAAAGDLQQAQDAIRAESNRLIASAQDNYSAAMDTLKTVDADLKSAQSQSFTTNDDLIRLNELQREASANQEVYQSFLVRAKQTAEQENIVTHNARVIADAAVPGSPSFPPRLPLLAAAGVLGLFIGILAAILRDVTSTREAKPSESTALAPLADRKPMLSGLVVVTTLEDGEKSRQAALRLAQDALSRHRKVIFVDLAEDAPASMPGLADIAAGEATVADAVHQNQDTGLHMLYAGRRVARITASREIVCAVLEAITAEYDDVVVNVGELDGEHGLPTRAVTDLTRQIVLVVEKGGPDARERRVAEVLSSDDDVAVSLITVGHEARRAQVA